MKSQRSKVKCQNFKSKLKTFYFLIVFLTFDFLFLNLARAAGADLSLRIYPPLIQIQLDPPATVNTPITIQNRGQETVILEILFKPFTAGKARHRTVPGKGELGEVVYQLGKNPLIFEKIKVSENDEAIEKVVIGPRQNKTLNLYIDVPKSEPISDYYFSVVFISENKSKDKLNQSKILGGIATNVLLSIREKTASTSNSAPDGAGSNAAEAKVKIVEFSTPSFLEKGPVPFTIRLKNESKHFITPQGTISIKNIFGKTIGQVKLSPVNILEGSIRSQETPWQETLLFGPYTATLNISLSDKGHILIKTINFFVFPLWAFIGLTATVIIFFLIKKRLRTYRNKNL